MQSGTSAYDTLSLASFEMLLKATKCCKSTASFIPGSCILFTPSVWKGFVKITQEEAEIVEFICN